MATVAVAYKEMLMQFLVIAKQKLIHAQKVWQLCLIRITVPQSRNQLRSKEVSQAVEVILQVWCKKGNTRWLGQIFEQCRKQKLVKAITDYYKSKSIREKLKYALVVTYEEKTWIITSNQVNEDLSCNHIEAGTRLILEASKSKHPVVKRASDTNILALMCYADQQSSSENAW